MKAHLQEQADDGKTFGEALCNPKDETRDLAEVNIDDVRDSEAVRDSCLEQYPEILFRPRHEYFNS